MGFLALSDFQNFYDSPLFIILWIPLSHIVLVFLFYPFLYDYPQPSMATSLRSTLPRTLRRPSLLLRLGAAPLLSRRNFSEFNPTPIFHLNETEEMLKESVGRFAREVVLPKVREMDEAEKMDKGIVEQLFEQGLMGVEIEEEYGGSGMGFGAAVVAIEELARVDPSVSYFQRDEKQHGEEFLVLANAISTNTSPRSPS